jgi:hypothetical protein
VGGGGGEGVEVALVVDDWRDFFSAGTEPVVWNWAWSIKL